MSKASYIIIQPVTNFYCYNGIKIWMLYSRSGGRGETMDDARQLERVGLGEVPGGLPFSPLTEWLPCYITIMWSEVTIIKVTFIVFLIIVCSTRWFSRSVSHDRLKVGVHWYLVIKIYFFTNNITVINKYLIYMWIKKSTQELKKSTNKFDRIRWHRRDSEQGGSPGTFSSIHTHRKQVMWK